MGATPQESVHLLSEADAHDVSGRYVEAASVLDCLIESARANGHASAVLVTALTRRAALARYSGHMDQARDLLDEATRLLDAIPVVDQVVACEVLVELGRSKLETSGPDAADEHLGHALAVARGLEPGPARDTALPAALTAMGASKRVRGDYPGARILLDDAVRHAQAAADQEPASRRAAVELAHALDELGVLHKFSGAFAESQAAYGRALELLTKVAGPDHPDLATIEHNLGGLAHARGDDAAAEVSARRAVQLHERSLGPDHVATVLDRSALAAILDRRGARAEAEALLRDCAGRLERTLGPTHRELAVVLNNIAAIDQRAGRSDDARELYERAAAIKERSLGPDAPSLAITLNNLATVERRQGRFSDAAAHYSRALDIVLRSAGPDHPHVAIISRNLARLESDRSDTLSDG